MQNIYIDPPSYYFLSNRLFNSFKEYKHSEAAGDRLSSWNYLKNYCLARGMNLNTIDFWQKDKKNKKDIYISLDHKNLLKSFFWHHKNKRYPLMMDLNNFEKKILMHLETPMVTPEIYKKIDRLVQIYDRVYFTCKVNNKKCGYFHIPQPYDRVLADFYDNYNRKFLVTININKKPRPLRLLRIYTKLRPKVLQKELLGERIKIIEFFSRTNDIDLYGLDWDKTPPFPYWFYKDALRKVYQGSVESKYQKLSEYKFAIAFENCVARGFIGEALFDCFYTGTVPIYLGAPDIEEYVPKNCFIDVRDFKDYGELRQFLKSLSEEKNREYRENGRRFLESEKFKPFTKEYFAEFFVNAVLN